MVVRRPSARSSFGLDGVLRSFSVGYPIAMSDDVSKLLDPSARLVVHAGRGIPSVLGGFVGVGADQLVPGSGAVVAPYATALFDHVRRRLERNYVAFGTVIEEAAALAARPIESIDDHDSGAFYEAFEQLVRALDDRASVALGRLVASVLFEGAPRDGFFRDVGRLFADASTSEWDELIELVRFLGDPLDARWPERFRMETDAPARIEILIDQIQGDLNVEVLPRISDNASSVNTFWVKLEPRPISIGALLVSHRLAAPVSRSVYGATDTTRGFSVERALAIRLRELVARH